MKFRPCIDLHNGKVKQIIGSTLDDSNNTVVENFVSPHSPDWYAKLFKKDGLKGGHVIMLGQGNTQACLNALSAWEGGLQAGGGINPENAGIFLDGGASHVIVTSYVFQDGKIDFYRLKEIEKVVGKKRLVLDISCRKKGSDYFVVTDRWQKWTSFKLNSENISLLESYCDELLIHAVDVEGMRQGIDEELVALLAQIINIPATYAGGVASIEDIKLINKLGHGRLDFTVGSSLDIYGGSQSYESLLKLLDILE